MISSHVCSTEICSYPESHLPAQLHCVTSKRCPKTKKKTDLSTRDSFLYRSALRLFCNCYLPTTPWLELKVRWRKKTIDYSCVPHLTELDVQHEQSNISYLDYVVAQGQEVGEMKKVEESAEKWESKLPLHCITEARS